MSSKELMLKILKKTMLTPEKVVERTNVNAENFNNLLEKNIEMSISDYEKLSEYFKLSIGSLATGNLDENDKAVFNSLKPAVYELVDEFISKCTEIVKKAGFESEINVLVPKAIYRPFKNSHKLVGFEGGVFFTGRGRDVYRIINEPVKVSLRNILLLDDFDLFSKVRNLVEVYDDTYKGQGDKFKKLTYYHIRRNEDLGFIKELDLDYNKIKGDIIYKYSDDNPKYWEIMKILLDKGAYLTKMESFDAGRFGIGYRQVKDLPSTLLFIDLVKRKTKG